MICVIIIIVDMVIFNFDYYFVVWNIMVVISIISMIVIIVIWNRLCMCGINFIVYIVLDVVIKLKILFLWMFGFVRMLFFVL